MRVGEEAGKRAVGVCVSGKVACDWECEGGVSCASAAAAGEASNSLERPRTTTGVAVVAAIEVLGGGGGGKAGLENVLGHYQAGELVEDCCSGRIAGNQLSLAR